MTRKYLSILVLILAVTSLAAEKLISYEDDGRFGFKNQAGQVRITARYLFTTEFNNFGFASVIEDSGFYFIDQKGAHRFEIFAYDNGPDYFSEGLARFVEKKKMGFFNEKAEAVIPAKFDFATPFENGLAVACNECKRVMHGEHWSMEGGKWIVIQKNGKQVIPAEFDAEPSFDGKKVSGKIKGVAKTFTIP